VPTILNADYLTVLRSAERLARDPAVAGPPRLQITMGGASGFDLTMNPPNQTYRAHGSPPISKVVELVEVED
jgi:hypothetical protein